MHIDSPPTSHEPGPHNFFLRGCAKKEVFLTKPTNFHELRQQITEVCTTITRGILTNIRTEFENRLYYRQEVGGSQFEHLIEWIKTLFHTWHLLLIILINQEGVTVVCAKMFSASRPLSWAKFRCKVPSKVLGCSTLLLLLQGGKVGDV